MRLYFYHLDNDQNLRKDTITGVQENKHHFRILAGNKSILGGLTDWKLPKTCCDVVQIDASIYKPSPFIISKRDDLSDMPGLKDSMTELYNLSITLDTRIQDWHKLQTVLQS